MPNILCIDDEPSVGVVLEHTLNEFGHRTVLVGSVGEAMKAVAGEPFDLIISDYRMPEATGIDLLDLLREQGYDIPVIITTGYASVEHAVQSMRHGAVDYLTKPLRSESLRLAVHNAIELFRLRRQNEECRRELNQLRGGHAIVGESESLRHALEMIAAVAPTRATVLLEGESGTGKELFARALHDQSPRFGHERGAFTGATGRALGAFERAHGGTLLLDEISEMRLDLQSKLLRAIQEQEFERVGGNQPVKVDVRIVATTNRDLAAEVEAGRFRRDLYYRLHVVPIRTPPLRERPEDVAPLVHHFVKHFAAQLGVRAPEVPPATIEHLRARPWPGNVRELANAVERAVILCRTGELATSAFGPAALAAAALARNPAPAETPTPLEATLNLKVLEGLTIERALRATGGHRTRAAELLGISERTLRNKLNTRSD
jgi:DNA-binding NtrC family response regulator